jgi:hypothetical protein
MRFAAVLCASVFGACSPSPRDAKTALRDYGVALEQGRAQDAYALLAEEVRQQVSFAQFQKMLKDSPDEARDLAKLLRGSLSQSAVRATITTDSGETLDLVLENGSWKIQSSAIELYPQDTPRHALNSFVRAVERKRYDVILRLAPDAKRADMTPNQVKESWEGPEKEEVSRVASAIRNTLPTGAIEQTGGQASFLYGIGVIYLVVENGRWKIEDFHLRNP